MNRVPYWAQDRQSNGSGLRYGLGFYAGHGYGDGHRYGSSYEEGYGCGPMLGSWFGQGSSGGYILQGIGNLVLTYRIRR